ncbi:hypothetical protein BN1723_003592 [Verticillium longisporum]|uniref:Galactose-1-phosphate uridylyltransferase n=2 Tax=Verticillium longisporum TaxID=100787 RepID=A0A0G4M705_VERLO|nr:hypothetical protein BN1723_003592 [Verticillium longisporum]
MPDHILDDISHRRYNPLRGNWLLVSPHRTKRPWQGQKEEPSKNKLPEYDPACYLCPRNARAAGDTNPDYKKTLIFVNDYSAVKEEQAEYNPPDASTDLASSLLRAESATGRCYVLTFSPKHHLTLADMTPAEISKLEAFAAELEQKYPKVQSKILAMDFARDDNADYDALAATVAGLDVAILINNVGQSHSIPVSFVDTTREELQSIVTINCLGTLKTTSIIAPIMVQRKKGLILTMGSFAGWIPTPYLATYSGSKAFLQHWNSSLAEELKPSGVDTQLVLSYLITTAMSKVRRASALIPTPKNFVKATLGKIGSGSYQNWAYTYTPWWTHSIMVWALESTLGTGNALGIWYNGKMHKDIRRRALRKAEREAKKA